MAHYKVPQKDILFALHDVLEVDKLAELPGFEEATSEIIDGVVDEAAKFVEGVIEPLRESADAVGARWQDGDVILPDGMKEAYKQFVDAGWASLSTHTDFGGQGLPFVLSKVVEEMLCGANVSFALYPGLTSSCFEAIEAVGSDEIKQLYLPKLATGEVISSFCLTEPDVGSDAASLKTRADKDGDHYILNGTKRYITNGPEAGLYTVMARTDQNNKGAGGITAFIVEGDTPGLIRGKPDVKMGQKGAHVCDITFEDCRVPAENIIGGKEGQGFKTAMKVLDRGRLHISAVCVGVAERLIEDALRFAMERKQFGAPLADHQLIQAMLADSRAEAFAGRSMVLEAARSKDAGKNVSLDASCCKLFCAEMVGRVADRAVQIHGGAGYMAEYAVERFYRDVRLFRIYEGTTQIQQIVIARGMVRDAQ